MDLSTAIGLSVACPHLHFHGHMEGFAPPLFDNCLTQAVEKIALFPHLLPGNKEA